MPHDGTLLRRYAADRAEDAFAEIVRRHLDGVYSAALRRVGGDVHLAEDVAQQVFSALAMKAEKLARHPSITGWLYTATRHAAANVVRGERRRKQREQEARTMHEDFSPPAPETDWSRVAPLLDEAIDGLAENDRVAILARFIDRRAFGEIGAMLHIGEDAARMRVERALDRLRAQLVRRGIGSTSAALSLALTHHAVAAAPSALAAKLTATAVTAWAGPGAIAGIFGFMSTTKMGVAGLAALSAMIGVVVHQSQTRETAEQALGTARTEQATQSASLRADHARVRSFELETARLQKAADEARAVVVAPPASVWNPTEEGRAFLGRNPGVKRALADYVNASLRFQYAPMYRSLGWTDDQIRRFEETRGRGHTMGTLGLTGKSMSMPNGAKYDAAEYQNDLTAAVGGEENMRRYPEFSRVAQARGVAPDVASALYFTDTPLTAEQADHIVQILVNSRNSGPAAKTTAYDWNAVMAKSEGILSAAQLEVFAAKRARDLFNNALNRASDATGNPVGSPSNPKK